MQCCEVFELYLIFLLSLKTICRPLIGAVVDEEERKQVEADIKTQQGAKKGAPTTDGNGAERLQDKTGPFVPGVNNVERIITRREMMRMAV